MQMTAQSRPAARQMELHHQTAAFASAVFLLPAQKSRRLGISVRSVSSFVVLARSSRFWPEKSSYLDTRSVHAPRPKDAPYSANASTPNSVDQGVANGCLVARNWAAVAANPIATVALVSMRERV